MLHTVVASVDVTTVATIHPNDRPWVETLVAKFEIELALAEATKRLKQEFSDSAYAEQQRLIAAEKSYNDRLASLAGNE